mmetsp:Transcript_81890/g.217330  ORF Transcript_81890/g.217330 Transcript_81890/m.217330 type:complete len:217 (-) Transcript_81890:118-768(-)
MPRRASEAVGPCILEDAVGVAPADDGDQPPGVQLAALGHDAAVHGLVPGGRHRLDDLREEVRLDQEHHVYLSHVPVLAADDAGLLRPALGHAAEELQGVRGDGARAVARNHEGNPCANREARQVQEHAPNEVHVLPRGDQEAEHDAREGKPRQERGEQVAGRRQDRPAEPRPEPVHVHVDARAPDAPGRSRSLCHHELLANLHGQALDDPVQGADT